MRDLAESGMTMVVVTHEMGFAREVADQIWFMADGYIQETGDPEEFFAHPTSPRAQDFLKKILGIHFLVWIEIPCQIFLYKKEDICCPLVIQSIHHKNHERRLNKCPIMILS